MQIKIIKKYLVILDLNKKIKWDNKQIMGIKTKKIYLSTRIGFKMYPNVSGIK